eukprot:1159940-Pelagomonas_calceolata.AAC.13
MPMYYSHVKRIACAQLKTNSRNPSTTEGIPLEYSGETDADGIVAFTLPPDVWACVCICAYCAPKHDWGPNDKSILVKMPVSIVLASSLEVH